MSLTEASVVVVLVLVDVEVDRVVDVDLVVEVVVDVVMPTNGTSVEKTGEPESVRSLLLAVSSR